MLSRDALHTTAAAALVPALASALGLPETAVGLSTVVDVTSTGTQGDGVGAPMSSIAAIAQAGHPELEGRVEAGEEYLRRLPQVEAEVSAGLRSGSPSPPPSPIGAIARWDGAPKAAATSPEVMVSVPASAPVPVPAADPGSVARAPTWPRSTAWGPTAAGAIQVSPTGVNGPGCGSAIAPCGTLQYAVDVVVGGMGPGSGMVHVQLAAGGYGPLSCGGNATRPLSITGAGPGATVLDCGGVGRALFTNSSIVMVGLTVTGGAVTVNATTGNVTYVGGGAVAVVWQGALPGTLAHFEDVAWVNNSASIVASAGATCVAGGGALSIHGDCKGCKVVLIGCVVAGNTLHALEDRFPGQYGGGGVSVVLGTPSGVTGATVEALNVLATGNQVNVGPAGSCHKSCHHSTMLLDGP